MQAPPLAPPLAPPPSAPPETDTGALIFGILVTMAGAAVLAFSMIVQRYALAYPSEYVPIGCMHLKRNKVWALGIVFYLLANVLKAIGFNYGPMTVLASVFTTLLIFNLFFAKWLLNESITPPKVAGAVLVLVGAFVSCGGTPGLTGGRSPPTKFTPAAIRALLGDTPPKGVFFAALLLLVIGTCVVIILRHERSHPDAGAQLSPQAVVAGEDLVERSTRKLDVSASPPLSRSVSATPGNGVPGPLSRASSGLPGPMKQISPTIVALQRASTQPKLEQIDKFARESIRRLEAQERRAARIPPWWAAALAVLYPASLGLDETISDLCTRGYSSMLSTCDPAWDCLTDGASWVFVLAVVVAITAGLASALFWMRIVYKRYETTVALPIEYGALNAGNLLGGMLVYAEEECMEGWQIGLAVVGLLIILVGIGVGQLKTLPGFAHKSAPVIDAATIRQAAAAASSRSSCWTAASSRNCDASSSRKPSLEEGSEQGATTTTGGSSKRGGGGGGGGVSTRRGSERPSHRREGSGGGGGGAVAVGAIARVGVELDAPRHQLSVLPETPRTTVASSVSVNLQELSLAGGVGDEPPSRLDSVVSSEGSDIGAAENGVGVLSVEAV